MTGKSIPWKMNEEELKEFLVYIRKPISAALIMGGTGLMMEHLFTFDGFDMLDFWEHEMLGLEHRTPQNICIVVAVKVIWRIVFSTHLIVLKPPIEVY